MVINLDTVHKKEFQEEILNTKRNFNSVKNYTNLQVGNTSDIYVPCWRPMG